MTSMSRTKSTHTFRLQTMSVPDLTEGLIKVRLRLNRAGVLHRGRKLKDGPLLNAIVAWYLRLDDAEQDRIAAEGLAGFEAILDGAGTPPAPPAYAAGHDVDDGPETGRHKRRA